MPSDALTKFSIQNTPVTPKVGDVRSRVGGQTNYYTSASLNRPPRTGFKVQLPESVPSEALNGNVSIPDVRSERDNREQLDLATAQFETDFGNLMGRINSPTASSSLFINPSEAINRLLLGRPTETQNKLNDAFGEQADATKRFAEDYTKTATDARNQFGIPELQSNLAETRKKFADRQVKLRQTLRDFETNAELRGVAREFVDREKQAIESEAYQELADLAIIETAQLGNLTEARTEVTNLLADKEKAYQFEYAGIQSEIDRLTQLNTQDAENRAQQLTVALAEKKAQDEKQLAFEANKYNALVESAPFADSATLDAIRNSNNPFELATLAGPFIGRLDRMQAEANIAQSYASAAASNTNRMLALAEAGDLNAISKLGFDPRTIEEEIDPVTRRQLESSIDAGTNLIRLADKYKTLIDNYGYTNTAFGNTEVLGEISSLRALMTAEYKKAETLGTLDAGVLALMSQIIGEEPTSGLFTPFTNATGRKSNKLSSQLNTFIENMTLGQAKDKQRLGIEPTVDFSLLPPEDDAEINAAFGVNTTTSNQAGFNPQTYFLK